jgi:tight adherence protein C
MTPSVAWAVVAGLALGFGLWSWVSLVPILNRPRLQFRVAPYVVDVSPGARALLARRSVDPLPVVGTLLGPAIWAGRTLLERVLGGADLLRVRLRQSGSRSTIEEFRSRQLLWGVVGTAVGLVVAVAARGTQATPLPVLFVLMIVCALAGVVLCDVGLKRSATKRLDRMASELPTILEFLTLALSAGEGVFDGMRRVSRISTGELATEFAGVVAAVNTGIPFASALSRLAADIRLPALTRATEQIVGALERGTPLVEVLRAQAQDSRDVAKRDLLETAGKKEVAMMIPLVFMILPMTIVFAIWPGIFVLQVGF